MSSYSKKFYARQRDGSERSARAVLPGVLDLVRPASVADVGCGVGTWLSVVREHGIEDVLGIDGAYVDLNTLSVPRECFATHDLRLPLNVERRFDLVLSMEVAEHLPGDSAETFIDNITRLGPVALFSAAAPYQGGQHHHNEQWPMYWVEKFARRGFVAMDCVRRSVWQNPDVDWPYAQNSLLFAERARVESCPRLAEAFRQTTPEMLSIVHPQALQNMRFKSAVRVLGGATVRALRRRLGLVPTRRRGY